MTSVTGSLVAAAAVASPTSTHRASPQGGIFDKANPTHYDSKNPLVIFIIQAGLIIIFCRLIHIPLSRMRQPRVISEVLGGILLGPSVMGRIPGFRETIFPDASIPNLNLVANLGLVLYLFMIGVETDLRSLISNWRVAASVSAAGMLLPFGLGCAIAYGLYHAFRQEPGLAPIGFGTYLLFIGIAMAITAFPVLCRILTELDLLSTRVGVIVLSAGVGNDVVGWILLALCVALVNASTGLTALWVLLTCVGFTLVLVFAVRPVFLWYLRRTGSLHDGPNQSVVTLTLLLVLSAAFFTQIIGVHAIFGGFMIGLICPHDGGFAIKLTEKIEDVIGALFLPLYFALSGLNTNIGLLDSGTVWGYVFGVIFIALIAKVTGGMVASRLNGLLWRESLTIGVLMSCKGLVELIVLNIGLQAKILSPRTFTIFVVMALVTTFVTTPVVSYLYPPSYQIKVERWRRGEIDWEGNVLDSEHDPYSGADSISRQKSQGASVRKLMIYLRLDSLPSLFTFVSLLGAGDGRDPVASRTHHAHTNTNNNDGEEAEEEEEGRRPESARRASSRPIEVHAVRLVELTDRDSSVMKVSEVQDSNYSFSDPILNAFRTFGQLYKVAVSGGVVIAPEHAYAETLVNKARDCASDLVLVPWSETGGMSERQIPLLDDKSEKFSTGPHSSFIFNILKNSRSNVGIFINKGFGGAGLARPKPGEISRTFSGHNTYRTNDLAMSPSPDSGHHIFMPYFGGPDDQFALRLVLQLANNSSITATIAYMNVINDAPTPQQQQEKDADETFYRSIRDSVPPELRPRVVFQTVDCASSSCNALLATTRETAAQDLARSTSSSNGNLVVVGRNSLAMTTNSASAPAAAAAAAATGSPSVAPRPSSSSAASASASPEFGHEAKKAIGVLGEAMAGKAYGIDASVLIVQASH
ncbi:K+ homeostasis protein Kha1, putative [Trichophyton verrucosum HKI 0517]|uniref:K+ homeostasis protein Kha1, putative n=1 Tax=Trichophyton verrucosum (strain HKI 0517) TaxID=663202 RepID=D4DCQ6_TRIVH|nr:K+ homeostasis protein Kha1, putative [Trichophyton verrucosum HKI 0517]EFE40428.1 K+ homeostasis protein Kha1, putative [Trichophyton verrucosum HKI 0517]